MADYDFTLTLQMASGSSPDFERNPMLRSVVFDWTGSLAISDTVNEPYFGLRPGTAHLIVVHPESRDAFWSASRDVPDWAVPQNDLPTAPILGSEIHGAQLCTFPDQSLVSCSTCGGYIADKTEIKILEVVSHGESSSWNSDRATDMFYLETRCSREFLVRHPAILASAIRSIPDELACGGDTATFAQVLRLLADSYERLFVMRARRLCAMYACSHSSPRREEFDPLPIRKGPRMHRQLSQFPEPGGLRRWKTDAGDGHNREARWSHRSPYRIQDAGRLSYQA